MPFSDSASARVHYEVGGEGPALLLINGLVASAYLWPRQWLADLEMSFRVVRTSNRGTGHTRHEGDLTVPVMAGDALSVLDDLDIDRAHVLGFSMGGMVAQTLALDHAERVRRLVLCSTTHGGVSTAHPDFVQALGEGLPGGGHEATANFFPLIAGPGYFDNHPETLAELAELWLEAPTPWDTLALQLTAAAGFDVRERLGEIAQATLVLHGTEDRLIMYENGPRLAEGIPTARLETYEGVGHMLPFEASERSAGEISEFLQAVDAG